ncbi:hypothetical protein GJAV_G00007560 [Gymnothorax javanicus]|nr:hypothetical protein GJAV_G00007560 [Gymnothorax javanicus]
MACYVALQQRTFVLIDFCQDLTNMATNTSTYIHHLRLHRLVAHVEVAKILVANQLRKIASASCPCNWSSSCSVSVSPCSSFFGRSF